MSSAGSSWSEKSSYGGCAVRRPLPFLLLLVFLTLLLTTSFPFGQTAGRTSERRHFTRIELSHGQKYVPGEALVRFKPGTGRRAMLSSHARVGATVKRGFRKCRRFAGREARSRDFGQANLAQLSPRPQRS